MCCKFSFDFWIQGVVMRGNTSARWLANSSTFSESLLAHDPGVVEFLRIRGEWCSWIFPSFEGFPVGVVEFKTGNVGSEGCIP